MNKLRSSRYLQLLAIILLLMMILIIRLFVLTVLEKNTWTEAATELTVKTIYTTAPRGQILDRNGKVLAGNAYTLSIRMSRGNMTDELTNQTIMETVNTLAANGDEINDNFPILLSESGNKTYDKGTKTKPFLETFGITDNLNADKAFARIKAFYKISNELSEEEARKIMVVRHELSALGYKKYMPAVIARDISKESVVMFEENGKHFPGVEVFTEVSRNYPKGSRASHLLGYMGKISDDEIKDFIEEKGYKSTDLIGKDGLERAYESYLKGKDGEKKVQVDSSGNLVKVLGEEEAKKGKDIQLSIDLELQEAAERSLKKALKTMRGGGTYTDEFGSSNMRAAPKARVGAVVAVEVKTGDLLAMASYPDFDPNLFTHGITTEDWEPLQSKNPRDPLSPAPMYNVATRSAVQPGSTFKMVTATAALQSGLDPKERLYDDGYLQFGNRTFGCLAWNRDRKKHGYIDLQEALKVSCNYYFYDIANGEDFYTGEKLNYRKKMTVDTITDYASQYGLGQKTGIEIPETVTGIPTAEDKIEELKGSLSNELWADAETYFTKAVTRDDKILKKNINEIVSWTGKKLTRNQIQNNLEKKLGVKKKQISKLADLCLYTYFNQATWNVGDTLNISIGQGANNYTPIQMANYVATLGNYGVKNQISMVEKIEDHGTIEKQAPTKVRVDDDAYYDEIIGGMVRVANESGGGLNGLLGNMQVTVAGKTGTAERAGKINPPSEIAYIKQHLGSIAPYLSWSEIKKEMKRLKKDYPDIYKSDDIAVRRAVINLSEGRVTTKEVDRFKDDYDNFAWVVTLAPAEEPEIAVVVMIAQGGTAGNAAPVAREVLGKYFKQLEKDE